MRPREGQNSKNGGISRVWERTPIGCGNREKRSENAEKKTEHTHVENCSVQGARVSEPERVPRRHWPGRERLSRPADAPWCVCGPRKVLRAGRNARPLSHRICTGVQRRRRFLLAQVPVQDCLGSLRPCW